MLPEGGMPGDAQVLLVPQVLGPATAAGDLGQHDARLAPPTLGFLNSVSYLVHPVCESTYMCTAVNLYFTPRQKLLLSENLLSTKFSYPTFCFLNSGTY